MDHMWGVRMGRGCIAHRHTSWVPENAHHVWPLGDGGPDTWDNQVILCANAHYSVHSLLDLARKAGSVQAVPWQVRRQYGSAVRVLATLGWERIQRQAM